MGYSNEICNHGGADMSLCLRLFCSTKNPTPYVSKVWVADNGDGTYKNPILYADYSDPDVTPRRR